MDQGEICDAGAPMPAIRRYTREMIIAGVLYAAVVIAAGFTVNRFDLPAPAVVAIALAPMAVAVLMLRAYIVLYRALDEFQRRVQGEAILIAAGLVGFGALGYGFLEAFADFPRVSLIWVLPAMIMVWGVAQTVVRRRYR